MVLPGRVAFERWNVLYVGQRLRISIYKGSVYHSFGNNRVVGVRKCSLWSMAYRARLAVGVAQCLVEKQLTSELYFELITLLAGRLVAKCTERKAKDNHRYNHRVCSFLKVHATKVIVQKLPYALR